MTRRVTTARKDFEPLSDSEIESFFSDLDRDKDGYVTFEELEAKLHEVHKELAPDPQKHHLTHPDRRELEKGESHTGDGLHDFLCSLMPDCGVRVARDEFCRHVRGWNIPSQRQTSSEEENKSDRAEEGKLPLRRRIRAYWAVHGPSLLFLACVGALMIAFGGWQMAEYIINQQARAAFGWGVIVAKASAGVLYPTFFFMLLSMSRHFATFLRRSYILSKFINADFTQGFHVKMSCIGLFFASLHAIGHLTGTFLYGSRPAQQDNVAAILGPDAVPRPYRAYVATLPGWSGITSLGLFWIIALLSMPFVRKRSYEVFQIGHLLMFPMIGLLCAHGTARLLQAPMLGYWLAFPALLVILERMNRLIQGFRSVPARAKILDNDTVELSCRHPRGKDWKYSAGQYILLQVPSVSFFQWHPFTISACRGSILQVHIKFDGDWTNKLRDLPDDQDIRVGIDGPFGAPAQRFYDYDCSIIVGGGIGITPFSAILTNLEENFQDKKDPWDQRRRSSLGDRSRSRARNSDTTLTAIESSSQTGEVSYNESTTKSSELTPTRRVDFHWMVREKNQLLWFSGLLNRGIEGAAPLAKHGNLQLNINTHITAKRKNISVHVFRYLLDSYRTEAAPYSALTGLKAPSHFGRPNWEEILDEHFEDVVRYLKARENRGGESAKQRVKVGVFYCGTPVVGEILYDRCQMLTARARHLGLKVRYDFMIEVFG